LKSKRGVSQPYCDDVTRRLDLSETNAMPSSCRTQHLIYTLVGRCLLIMYEWARKLRQEAFIAKNLEIGVIREFPKAI